MKKLVLLISILAVCLPAYSNSYTEIDTIDVEPTDTVKEGIEFYAGGIIASRNYARGVNFGAGPSIQPYAGFTYKGLIVDFFAEIGGNGVYNYGTTHDFSISYENRGFKIGIHDYYFFSKYGNHNYFFQTSSDTMNGHYYEAQVSYTNDKFSVLAAHNFYNTNLKVTGDYWAGVYLEGIYKVNKDFSVILAGLTGPSIVNFYDAAGFTTVGIQWSREIKTEALPLLLDVKFHVNPNYRNISPGVQQAPMNIFASITF